METRVTPDLYDPLTCKGPLETTVELVQQDGKSFKLRTTVYLAKDGTTLAECDVQSVVVSASTRKPTEPPSWWREEYAPHIPQVRNYACKSTIVLIP